MPIEFPNKDEIEFKEKFIRRYEKLTDFEEFKKYSLSFLRRSIRVNTLKITVGELKKRMEKEWTLEPIPWCKEGFWVEHRAGRRDIGNTIDFFLGNYYVQEAASMIPPIALDVKPGMAVLDMCASPGSKTTQIAQYMQNKGILIANDYQAIRTKPLQINLQRCGASNAVITMMEGQRFKDMQFDRVLVDAPCSGTGTIRKSVKTLRMWNPAMTRKIAGVQKRLITKGFELLKEKGVMVYSTCSLEPEENEEVVDYLLKNNDNAKLDEINLSLKRSEPILEFESKKYNPEVKKCLRLWPQDNDTEGFFVAKVRKI